MLSSRYKNGKDPMPSSSYVSIEAYPFALPRGERIEGERIDACSRAVSACWYGPNFRLEKNDFCLVSCTPLEGPPKPSLRWARCLTTGSVYFVFHCNNQLLLHFSIIGAGNKGLTSRPNESFVGGSSCVVRSFDGEFGSLRRYHRYSIQGTAGKAECDTRRVSPEHLARPISQACTGIAVQPAVKVLGPWRAPLQQMLQNIRASRTPRASSRGFHAKTLKIRLKIEIKAHALPGRTNGVRLLLDKWLAIARRVCLCMV